MAVKKKHEKLAAVEVGAEAQELPKEQRLDGVDSGHYSITPKTDRAPTPQEARAVGDLSDVTTEVFRLKIVAPNTEPFDLQVNNSEMIQEVYQVLLEREVTCHRTCFSLQLNGQRLDNFTEVRAVPGLVDGSVITVVEEPYTVREARIHLRHVLELVKGGSNDGYYEAASGIEGQSLSFLPTINLLEKKEGSKPVELPSDYILPGAKERPLSHLLAIAPKTQAALNNISLSPYNPPVGPRKMKGDVIYLIVDTAERRRVHITCCTKGFYVNASSDDSFKPTISNQNKSIYHSLVDLLSITSPMFKKTFPLLIRKRLERHLLDRLPTPYPVYAWIVPAAEQTQDSFRAEDATHPHRVGFEDHLPGQIRDWNEELQTTHDMPRTNINDRIVRDRSVFKIHGDFIGAAVKGATSVIDGNVMAINPADEPRTHMFIWNNIFFSLGFDVKDHYKELGGDAAAHAATSLDLQGVRAYSALDDSKLCTLGMAVIDYKGYRITAQSIIPGILDREQEQSVVYGSIDFGKTVVSNERYVELLEKAAFELKILPHAVISTDAEGNEKTVKLYTSYETKGIVGNDGRNYVLDLLRTMPPDAHFLENGVVSEAAKNLGFPRKFPHKLASLRHELVEAFIEFRYMMFIRVAAHLVQQARVKEVQDKKITTEDVNRDALLDTEDAKKIVNEALPSKEDVENDKQSQELITKAAVAAGSLSDTTFDLRFNPDCYSTTVKHTENEDLEKQRKLVADAGEFLLTHQLPGFVQECVEHQIAPIDGGSLSDVMHSKGINIRYLGEVMKKVESSSNESFVKSVVATELVVRCAKHVIRKVVQDVASDQLACAIAHILNALIGSGSDKLELKKFKKASGLKKSEKWSEITQKSLWRDISEDCLSYYGYDLDMVAADSFVEKFAVQKVSFFRRICNVMGFQMLLKDYQFEKKALPFVEDDVQNMVAVTKHKQPMTIDAKQLYLRGQAETAQGNLKDAYEFVAEAVNLMTSVYGAMHSELALALRLLARLSYILGDPAEALAQQHKAALMSERCNGVDHSLTIIEYINLSHFAFANLYVHGALRLLYRARYLLLIAHGEGHPLMSQIDGNIGVILYACQEFDLALKFLTSSDSYAKGEPKRLKSALLNHIMARAHSCRGDFRTALTCEKETFTIYKQLFGIDHDRTKESSECLKHLTQQAVLFQKKMNEAAKGNNVNQFLPIQTTQPSLPSILEVLNILNGIIIIAVPSVAAQQATTDIAPAEKANRTDKVQSVKTEDTAAKAALQQEILD